MATLPDRQTIEALHRKYAPNDQVYELVFGHCEVVAEIAQWCVGNLAEAERARVDVELLRATALLHDIGTYVLFDEVGKITNHRMYPQHAILGAKILLDEGLDERIAGAVETHVLLGVTRQEIIEKAWPLPARDYVPQTLEGELLCYADRFHSKHPTFNGYETFLARLREDMPLQAAKFEAWSQRFGVPDVPALAKKYGQPIR
jgi:uncharacterized protein